MLRLPALEILAKQTRLLVTVSGTITEVDPDDVQGSRHQLFEIRVKQVQADPHETGVSPGDLINVAFRYGDEGSSDERIKGLAVGEPIELRGAYVPRQQAYPDDDGDLHAVIHFTHRPLGWIEYHGRRYD